VISLPVDGIYFGTFYKKPDETDCSYCRCIRSCQLLVLSQNFGGGTEVTPAKCLLKLSVFGMDNPESVLGMRMFVVKMTESLTGGRLS
jgi:hypothetical protein